MTEDKADPQARKMPKMRAFKNMSIKEEDTVQEKASVKDYKDYLTYSGMVTPLLIMGFIAMCLT